MMSGKSNKETTSFKLLEEDSLEDKPTPHMKKVVGLVLEKKNLKDEDVTSSFRNLMEYREAPPSPSASSASAMEPECLGSPTTPSSPVPQLVDDERLPNELLDEICEDIGMKEGTELDFVEFLMEQDMPDPHSYMTPEAIMNSSSMSSGSQNSVSTVKQMHGGMQMRNDPNRCGRSHDSVVMSSTVTSGTSTVVSSGANSPVSKRFHPSTSGESSPTKTSAPSSFPPQSPQTVNSLVFKMPQTPPTPKRPLSSGNVAGRQSPSVLQPSNQCDDALSRDTVPLSHCPMTPSKSRCYSPKPNLPSCSQSPSQQKFVPQSPVSLPYQQQPNTLHYGQTGHQMGMARSPMQKSATATNYQRLGKPAPPVVNVQNMQHIRMMNQKQGHGNMQNCDPLTVQTNSQYGRTMDSLDQGYFSGDTGSVRSYGSNLSMPGNDGQIHVKTEDVSSMIPSIQHSNSVQPQRVVATVGHMQVMQQKSVHFADMPGSESGSECQNQQVDFNGGYNSDCFDLDQEFRENSQKSKILPRLTPSMKSEVAPYTVPGGSPYDFANRSSCGVTPGSRPGSGGSPAVNMQQFDFSGKGQDNMYYVDNNQNMLPNGEFNQMNNQMGNYQQNQQSYVAQQMNAYRGMSVTDSMKASSMAQLQQNEMYRNQMAMSQQQGNYDGSCNMNQNQNRMMGANQMGSSYNQQQQPQQQQQQQQGGGQQQYQQPSTSCATPRMNTQSNSTVTGPYGNMSASTSTYDQGMYNNGSQTPSRNMHPQMYQGQQQAAAAAAAAAGMGAAPGTPGQWNPQGGNQAQQNMQDMSHMKQAASQMQQLIAPSTPQNPQCPSTMPGASSMVPCTIPNCQSCKNGSPHRPPMLASQQTFIQHLITDRSNAFRSHPLFPLLRDLIIADMNFASPSFPYQLISNLPAEFDKLLQNFLHRNPPTGQYQGNFAVESVIMDALRYAHQCLIEKIRVRQEQDKHTKTTSKSLSAIEEFCEKFDRAVRNSIPGETPNPNPGNPMMMGSGQMGGAQMAGPMGMAGMGQMVKDPKYGMMDPTMTQEGFIPAMGKGIGLPTLASPQFRSIKDAQDSLSDAGSAMSGNGNHGNKSESKKHPSLPKEAVAIMLDWLRNHKDNPYPNDDEKAMLIKQTGLTINQINYWFTNARRRILPKWAQCK